MSEPAIALEGVSRHFGELRAVDRVSLEIGAGEFFALLGPSGSGKTTCLRLVAGFERPDAGTIRLFGADVTAIPPYRRDINTVFQDYALFPHLSVRDNVAYGLRMRGVARPERERRAADALELVKLPGFGERRPAQLSGGQRQRVALARAIVNRPRALLLDEPLGALDLKLREQMQEELRSLQRQLDITFVFVTHDQGEALSMADRIAIFDHGVIRQTGSPEEIYRRPVSRFVADFVGSSNVLPPAFTERLVGRAGWASLRPEDLRLLDADAANGTALDATVSGTSYLGGSTRLALDCDGQSLAMLLPSRGTLPALGARVRVGFDPVDLHVMEAER